MNTQNFRGRHRAPGRHNPLTELTMLARESAQPAMKGAAVVAATGGLFASFAGGASALGLTSPSSADSASAVLASVPQAATRAGEAAPAVVGPARAAAPAAASALATIGFAAATAAAPAAATAPTKPRVIEDVVVKANRKAAADRATAKVAADRQAAVKAVADKAAAQQAAAREAASRQAADDAASRQAADDAAVRKAAVRKAAVRKAATRAATTTTSRSLTRRTLTSSTATTKTRYTATNTRTPGASSGVRASRNWATPGQCTWGVLSKWYASTGFYPGGWTGNALVWDSGAAAAGYTVSSTPRTRSILVMEPGVHGASSSAGHVAWVTSVSGNTVTVIEMNALAGAFNYNTRTLSNGSGMRYIYAP